LISPVGHPPAARSVAGAAPGRGKHGGGKQGAAKHRGLGHAQQWRQDPGGRATGPSTPTGVARVRTRVTVHGRARPAVRGTAAGRRPRRCRWTVERTTWPHHQSRRVNRLFPRSWEDRDRGVWLSRPAARTGGGIAALTRDGLAWPACQRRRHTPSRGSHHGHGDGTGAVISPLLSCSADQAAACGGAGCRVRHPCRRTAPTGGRASTYGCRAARFSST